VYGVVVYRKRGRNGERDEGKKERRKGEREGDIFLGY
jgi:hypothetical protein